MVETKTQQRARLLAMRKKYGLGEFRKSKSIKRRAPSVSMAKRGTRRRSTRRSSFGKSLIGGGIWGQIIGVGGYIAYERYLSPRIPLTEPSKSLLELGVGLWLSKRSGTLGQIGKAAVVLNVYQLMSMYIPAGATATNDAYSVAYN